MLKRVCYAIVSISIVIVNFTEAKDYEVDKSGNVNVNIIDGKVIVNGKVVKSIPDGEAINISINSKGEVVENNKTEANIKKDIVSANVGDISVKIDGDKISVDIASVINSAKKNQNSKDTKEEEDFFKGDDFFK
jgi:hypothetical protein